jgi:hypothetical protein
LSQAGAWLRVELGGVLQDEVVGGGALGLLAVVEVGRGLWKGLRCYLSVEVQ